MSDKVEVLREELAALVDTLTRLRSENEELQEKYDALVIENGSRYGLVSPQR